MIQEPRYRPGQPIVWFNRNLARGNTFCLYCGSYIGPGAKTPSDKEHLIGRNFVPTGMLSGDAFNFIFRACRECNSRKGDAERHVSTVSLFSSPARASDPSVDDLARRKAAREYHPKKRGKLVQDASIEGLVRHQFGRAAFEFTLIGPPQLIPDEVLMLAGMQVQGLFTLATTLDYKDPNSLCLLPPDQIAPLGYYPASDWGNPHLLEVARLASPWEPRVQIVSANGYFRALLRRSAKDVEGWFWALEWNRSVRIVGAICSPSAGSHLYHHLPSLGWSPLPDGSGRIRQEIPIQPEDDALFRWDERVP